MSPEDRFLGTKEIFLKDYFYFLACSFLAFNISIHMYIPFKNSLSYKLDDKVEGGEQFHIQGNKYSFLRHRFWGKVLNYPSEIS